MVGFDSCVIFLPFFFIYGWKFRNKKQNGTCNGFEFFGNNSRTKFYTIHFSFFLYFFLSDSFCFVISCRDLFYFIFILILGFILSLMRVIRGPFGYFINRFTRIKKKSLT
jgi:hypothetical protein